MAKLIGVAGLPGSGKTTLCEEYIGKGFECIDDFRKENGWCDNICKVKKWLSDGKDVVITDIEFCRSERRKEVEEAFDGQEVQWVFFENEPYKCALNVVCRKYEKEDCKNRDVVEELNKIEDLSKCYSPTVEKEELKEVRVMKPKFFRLPGEPPC